ncbi:MAG TPA: alpha/beta hydrolase [Mycobacteriales bacterium]|nr:alpha/beta hydrolase [Mycobacteriales bacterium]
MLRRSVTDGEVTIAATDWQGDGPDLVLLHGLGPDQRSMQKLAAALSPAFRVVTYDQRCVGGSTEGPWTFAAAVRDLHTVIDGLGLANPVVVGHSLGGMIALMYAGERPDAPAVVNIDGWGPGTPDQFIGEDPAAVRRVQRQIGELKPQTRFGRALVAMVQRRASVRRTEPMRNSVITALWELDVIALHREAQCPVLAFNCTAPPAVGTRLVLGREAVRMLQTQRTGLRRDLDSLCETRPNVSVIDVAASHMSAATRPELFASHIRDFALR